MPLSFMSFNLIYHFLTQNGQVLSFSFLPLFYFHNHIIIVVYINNVHLGISTYVLFSLPLFYSCILSFHLESLAFCLKYILTNFQGTVGENFSLFFGVISSFHPHSWKIFLLGVQFHVVRYFLSVHWGHYFPFLDFVAFKTQPTLKLLLWR